MGGVHKSRGKKRAAPTDNVCFLPAGELAARIRRKELSARDLTQAYLARIERFDAELGAYLYVDAEGALAQADAVDQRIAAGATLGPLAGVPIALKDIFVTRDVPTTAGSRILAGWLPPYDGTAVTRLARAGAVLLGKLNMDEFAMGSSNESSAYKLCKNPWDTSRVPGGSSGGSTAAVAAGLAAAALGTDTGGSIRQPSAFCGTVGIKPTYGRVSRYGVVAFASSLDQVGPVTRTVEDAALLLGVIAGHDERDATSIETPAPDYVAACARDLQGVRVGVPKEYFVDGMEPDVNARVREAIATLQELGANIREVSLPHTEYAVACYYLIATAEASSNLARYDGVKYGLRAGESQSSLLDMYRETRGQGFGAEVKRRIMLGTFALRSGYYDAYYKKAQKVRALIKRDFDRAFENVDVLVSPTSPTVAFRLGEKVADPLAMYLADVLTISCPLAGLPGMSVPCGFSRDDLPVGLQLIGRPLGEEELFRVAAAYQHATDFHTRVPTAVAS